MILGSSAVIRVSSDCVVHKNPSFIRRRLSGQLTELIGSHVVTPAGGARRLIEKDVCG